MYFTKNDIKQLLDVLKLNSKKDTEFEVANDLVGDENIALIQKGENKISTLNHLSSFVLKNITYDLNAEKTARENADKVHDDALTTHTKQITTLQTKVQDVIVVNTEQQTAINSQGIRLTEVEHRADEQDTQIAQINTDMKQMDDNILRHGEEIEDLQEDIATKQQELTLTVLDNGNIRIGNLQGQTKDFMPATPSGDPMHYAYTTAGALYNDTDEPISRLAPWGTEEFWEKNADGTYTYWEEDAYVQHLPGCWYLSGIGDLSNSDMRTILNENKGVYASAYYGSISRVIKLKGTTASEVLGGDCNSVFSKVRARVIDLTYLYFYGSNVSGLFSGSKELEFVADREIYLEKCTMRNIFLECSKLKHIILSRISSSLMLDSSPLIYKRSILHLISNSKPTTPITVTLHPDAYVRIANQHDIIEALEAKNAELTSTGGSISLVSA